MSLGFGSPNRKSDKIIKEDTAASFSTRISLEVYLTKHTSTQTRLTILGRVIKHKVKGMGWGGGSYKFNLS